MQNNQNTDNLDYDVFSLEHMTDMAKMPGDVMDPGTHVHALRSSIQFSVWYKVLISQFREMHTNIASRHEHLGP